jgi:hypothetical protein
VAVATCPFDLDGLTKKPWDLLAETFQVPDSAIMGAVTIQEIEAEIQKHIIASMHESSFKPPKLPIPPVKVRTEYDAANMRHVTTARISTDVPDHEATPEQRDSFKRHVMDILRKMKR